MAGRRSSITAGWASINDWTFHLNHIPKRMSGWVHTRTKGNQPGTRIHHRADNGYHYPDDPSLPGETILRGIRESA
jgi:hypothetical protein